MTHAVFNWLRAGALGAACACAGVASAQDGAARIEADAALAHARIESFFGAAFEAPVRLVVAPDRAAFDAALPAEWGVAPSQCWMVGVGAADALYVLSPSAWATEACEHDGDNAEQVQAIVTHELTHAFHGQHNPTRDFTGMDDAGWFVEGVAVLVAGQLADPLRPSAADAIAAGAAPERLADAWGGRYRYAVAGSMAQYIDERFGRGALLALMADTSNEQMLARLGCSEAEFLAGWRAFVTRPRS